MFTFNNYARTGFIKTRLKRQITSTINTKLTPCNCLYFRTIEITNKNDYNNTQNINLYIPNSQQWMKIKKVNCVEIWRHG